MAQDEMKKLYLFATGSRSFGRDIITEYGRERDL